MLNASTCPVYPGMWNMKYKLPAIPYTFRELSILWAIVMYLSNDVNCDALHYGRVKQKMPQDVLMSSVLRVYQIELNATLCGCTYMAIAVVPTQAISLGIPVYNAV
jgi:hypothetical protein